MAAIAFRIALLAAGLALGELGLESFGLGNPIAPLQFAVALLLLVAGSAGFITPLLRGGVEREVADHV